MEAQIAPRLALVDGSKSFGSVQALRNVNFEVFQGEVHALAGENGAGKSSLIKVLTGVHRADDGILLVDGEPRHFTDPLDAQACGISTVYQEVNLASNLTVGENIMLGREPRLGPLIRWTELHRRAAQALEELAPQVNPREQLSSCSVAIRQLVAITRALVLDARVLVLDEPTSSLDAAEVASLFRVMRGLRERGMAIIFITHFLDQIFEIADRTTILRNGAKVGTFDTASLTKLTLISHMLGKELGAHQSHAPTSLPDGRAASEPPRLTIARLGRARTLKPCSIEAWPREVLGIAGLLGSGRSELAELTFGLRSPDTGAVTVDRRSIPRGSPRAAIRAGVALVPEDRKTQALFPNLSVLENILMALQVRQGAARRIPLARQVEVAARFVQALEIVTPSLDATVATLSGGNQQKVILARWLAAEPKVLLLDEPTRGVDVGAKAEIERRIAEFASQGATVLLIASEIEDIERQSHRVIVMRDRRVVGELRGVELNARAIMELIAKEHDAA